MSINRRSSKLYVVCATLSAGVDHQANLNDCFCIANPFANQALATAWLGPGLIRGVTSHIITQSQHTPTPMQDGFDRKTAIYLSETRSFAGKDFVACVKHGQSSQWSAEPSYDNFNVGPGRDYRGNQANSVSGLPNDLSFLKFVVIPAEFKTFRDALRCDAEGTTIRGVEVQGGPVSVVQPTSGPIP